MSSPIIQQLNFKLGANDLPYELPIHPHLVHFTLGTHRILMMRRGTHPTINILLSHFSLASPLHPPW